VTSANPTIGIESIGRAALLARAAESVIAGSAAETESSTSTTAGSAALGAVDAEATRSVGPAAETTTGTAASAPMVEPAPQRVSFIEAAQSAEPALPSEPTVSSKHGVRAPLTLPSISVDLSDEGLGAMQLQARQGPDGLHLTLTAADREVGAALARAGAELRRDLEAAGTTVGSLDIGQGSGGIGQGAGDRAGQRQGRADEGGARGGSSLGGGVASTTGRPPLITTTRTSSADAGLDLLI
jgi:flagellar hook-length control protein FliK